MCNWCFGWRDGEQDDVFTVKAECLLWKICGVLGLVQLATVNLILFFSDLRRQFQQMLRTKHFRRPHMRFLVRLRY
jgi:hypothetical protein